MVLHQQHLWFRRTGGVFSQDYRVGAWRPCCGARGCRLAVDVPECTHDRAIIGPSSDVVAALLLRAA